MKTRIIKVEKEAFMKYSSSKMIDMIREYLSKYGVENE